MKAKRRIAITAICQKRIKENLTVFNGKVVPVWFNLTGASKWKAMLASHKL